ncbi:WecB/TagA/CpsF family glycosyltransferase [Bradyrhizobium sp. STM 3843]|uniref:WecB/TagA/CpsF family glycosyltransferase n=1 Tax=Bradyrhizobium sp. STM 3843 TaxID=551947 RepID=UPI000317F36B|nr:WecB/TagA/CpsF family glycosyltransferase [Bradyrhizobium sp. STM 3843]
MSYNETASVAAARRSFKSDSPLAMSVSSIAPSNLPRQVYCILGLPIDAIELPDLVRLIDAAAANRSRLLVSTPNLNFLTSSLSDTEFRESVLDSDACPPDGKPIIWIARLLGLPIRKRAAGADLLDALSLRKQTERRLTAFLFGGAPGIAATAACRLNDRHGDLLCVGTLDPGFCDLAEMSTDDVIASVNESDADFLIVSLGAKKGQLWLQRNHDRLTIPVRSHLGAAINFQAGTVKRAPTIFRELGFEWLWRIKEERVLWRRYRDDGLVFARLLVTRVLPLLVITQLQRIRPAAEGQLQVTRTSNDGAVTLRLDGSATERNVSTIMPLLNEAISTSKDVIINLGGVRYIDMRFFGLLLMLRKELKLRGCQLSFDQVPGRIKRLFRLNEVGFLLTNELEGFAASAPMQAAGSRAV